MIGARVQDTAEPPVAGGAAALLARREQAARALDAACTFNCLAGLAGQAKVSDRPAEGTTGAAAHCAAALRTVEALIARLGPRRG
jgi:hypothetical protein